MLLIVIFSLALCATGIAALFNFGVFVVRTQFEVGCADVGKLRVVRPRPQMAERLDHNALY